MNSKQLYVFYEEQLVGVLVEDRYGVFSFEYDYKWIMNPNAFAISISLPLPNSQHVEQNISRIMSYQDDVDQYYVYESFPKDVEQRREEASRYLSSFKYTGHLVKSYFSGLLPEEAVLERVAEVLHINPGSTFQLLKDLGGDCAGALVLNLEYQNKLSNDKLPITREALSKKLEEWRIKPFFIGDNNSNARMSLAGAQYKMPIIYDGSEYFEPNGAPSTHIIKLPIAEIKHTVENEALCLTLAKLIGINTVSVKTVVIGDINYLLVDRYDRVYANNAWKRLHQEDICQAMGLSVERKYQYAPKPNREGPSIKNIAQLIRKHSKNPKKDLESLIKQVIFSFYIKNRDAHGKNYSFVYVGRDIELAPLYDVLNTEIYKKSDGEPCYDKKMAMKLGATYDAESVTEKDWVKFADDLGVSASYIEKTKKEILDEMKSKIDIAIRELFKKDVPDIANQIRDDILNLSS